MASRIYIHFNTCLSSILGLNRLKPSIIKYALQWLSRLCLYYSCVNMGAIHAYRGAIINPLQCGTNTDTQIYFNNN